MDVVDERIPDELYREIVARLPTVSVELVVRRDDGAVLLLERTNPPAEGEWFWPGGRLFKGERFEDAAHRIADEELGLDVALGERLGTYAHHWETGRYPEVEGTHTVNVVYLAEVEGEPTVALDDQHGDHRWLAAREDGLPRYVERYLDDADLV